MIERAIATAIHGRYVADVEPASVPPPLLVGFHGYAESAEQQLERLRSIPGAQDWLRISIQGLHRFYRGRGDDVVASWMTRQDRDRAIVDNVAYVAAVLDDIARVCFVAPTTAFAGFSQGVSMAFRAAAGAGPRAAGIIALGGDIPPELEADALRRIPAALIGRGLSDAVYSATAFDSDVARLRAAGVRVVPVVFEAGHEWTDAFGEAAGRFLAELK